MVNTLSCLVPEKTRMTHNLKPWPNGDASRRNLRTDLKQSRKFITSARKYDDASCKKSHMNAHVRAAIQYWRRY